MSRVNVTLGSTGIIVNKNGFGALPIQRVNTDKAVNILRMALDGGMNYYDTARAYTDSEEKIGKAFKGLRDKVIIATKTAALNAENMIEDLETSLKNLKTDYIDVYQFHNPPFCPKESDDNGLYKAALKAKKEGKIRHICLTNHRLHVAKEAIESGLYEILQFPFSYISGSKELELVHLCKEKNIGFVSMKGLSGGLLTNFKACYAFQAQYENVLPIWGIQTEEELKQWLSCVENPPEMTCEIKEIIEKDRKELSGNFCRSCGYCEPCTVGIQIHQCARMSQLIRRCPSEQFMTDYWKSEMKKISKCIDCGKCKTKCPYGLDIPNLLKINLEDYEKICS